MYPDVGKYPVTFTCIIISKEELAEMFSTQLYKNVYINNDA
jgi:hypothetical protein